MTGIVQFTRDQHIVPQWHLRNFADANGDLWKYKPQLPIRRSRPKGECWKKDFYECEINGRKTNNSYENWLRGIENDAAIAVPTLLSHSPLGGRDAAVWASYVASLFVRGEKYRKHISEATIRKFRDQVTDGDYVRSLQHWLLQKGELVPAEDIRRRTEQFLVQLETTPFCHLIGMQNNTVSLADALMRKEWHIIEACPGRFFVTSDCPVSTVELADGKVRPGAGYGKPYSAVILAVTPKHLFVAAAPGMGWKSVGDKKFVDSANLLTTQFAHRRVYAHLKSPEIKSLVDNEINKVLFGVNAFLPASQN